ncbi:MAG: hypothetical protein IPP22_00085 [Nitrosomonas sp.]|nr:hypothetical protein [Nitrosomonas sp.]
MADLLTNAVEWTHDIDDRTSDPSAIAARTRFEPKCASAEHVCLLGETNQELIEEIPVRIERTGHPHQVRPITRRSRWSPPSEVSARLSFTTTDGKRL